MFNQNQFSQPLYQNYTTGPSYQPYQRPPFYQLPQQPQSFIQPQPPQYFNTGRNPHYSQYLDQYVPTMKENQPYRKERTQHNPYEDISKSYKKSILAEPLNDQRLQIFIPQDKLHKLAEQLFTEEFNLPMNYSLNKLQFPFNEIKNTVAEAIPKFQKLLGTLDRQIQQTEHVYNYFMVQPDILPNTFFQGLQRQLQDKLSTVTNKVNQKVQNQLKKGIYGTTQPNLNEVKTIRRTEVKQQFQFVDHRKQMRKKLLKLSNNIIESVILFFYINILIYKFLLQHSTGSKLILQQFLQICLKIITLFQFLCLDNTSLAPFVSFNSALLFDQITITRKRLRPLDFLIITNENYETFARSMKNYQKQYTQFSTRNQNIINQLHQIIVKEAQLEGLSLINFNELANSVIHKEKNKFSTEVLKAYQDVVKRKTNDTENYLKNETLVETSESLKKQMEEWQELRNEQVKFAPIIQDVLGRQLTKDRIERIDPAYETNVNQIIEIEKTINYVNTLLSKSNDVVENVMTFKQEQEDFLQEKYQDILDMMHNDLKSKFTYFNINDQIEELFHELKEILKYEKMQSKDITHKIEKQLKKGKYKNEFLKQVQHTIELDKMMRSKEEQFVKTQEDNFKMQNYWQQQNIQQLHEQQMMQYYKAQDLNQQQLMDFAQTRKLTKLSQEQEALRKLGDYNLNNEIQQITQNDRDQQTLASQYEKRLEKMTLANQEGNEEIKNQLMKQEQDREAKRQEELAKRQLEKEKEKQDKLEAEERRKEDQIKRQEERAERERKIKEAQEEEEQKMKERKEQREQKDKEEKEKREREQIEKEEKLKAEKEQRQKDLEEKKKKESEDKEKREKERLDRIKKTKEEEERKVEELKQKREQQKREKEEKEKKEKEEREKRILELKERDEKEKKSREQKLKEEREAKAQREKEEKEKKEKERKEKEEKEQKLKEERERDLKERKQREEKEKKEREELLKKEKEEKERKEKERKEKEIKDREEKERKLKEDKEKRDKETKERKEKEEKEKKEKDERIKQQNELKAQKDKEEKDRKEREEKEKKEKAQKAQKEKEEREKKEKEDKEKKEREIREARQRQEQEKEQKEKEEKERKQNELKAQKEKEEKDRKEKEDKKEKDKKEKEKKEKAEKAQKEKEEELKKEQEKNKKQNQFDAVEDADDYFDDFDDDIPLPIEESPDTKKKTEDDDLIEELMSSPHQQKKPIQAKRMQAMQEFDDALDFDDDDDEEYKPDFDSSNKKSALDKQKKQKDSSSEQIAVPQSMSDVDKMEPNFFQPEQLINPQILELNNFYAQSVGIDQIDFNFEEFNNFKSVFMLFEEFVNYFSFIIQQNAYFFEFEDGAVLEQLSNEFAILKHSQSEEDALNTIEPKLQAFFQKVSTQYMQITQSEEFAKQTRYFFPFQNELSYFLIEVNPFVQRVIIYFTDQLNQEQQEEVAATMENMIQLIFYLLDLSELSVMNIEVHENSKLILKEFESLPYIQYMLAIFYIIYELDLQTFLSYNFMILFDEKIVDRMRLVLQSTKNLTAMMMDQQGLTEYQMIFEEMLQMYDIEQNPDIGILVKYLQLDNPANFQEMLNEELATEVNMLRSGKVEHIFLAIDLALEMVKHTYYVYMGKTQPEEQEQTKKNYNLMFYFYHGYSDEINQSIMMTILERLGINIEGPNLDQELQNSEFSLQSFFDYVRHPSTMEFPRITLALWVHLSFSRQLGSMNSLMLLSYSQLPNFAEYFMMQDQGGMEGLDEEQIKEMMAMQEAQQREAEAAEAAALKQKKPSKAAKVDKLAPISKDKKKKKIIK